MKSHFDEFTKKTRETRQRSVSLEQDARQPRLAMEADLTSNKKRTEGVAAAFKAKHGFNCSVERTQADRWV